MGVAGLRRITIHARLECTDTVHLHLKPIEPLLAMFLAVESRSKQRKIVAGRRSPIQQSGHLARGQQELGVNAVVPVSPNATLLCALYAVAPAAHKKSSSFWQAKVATFGKLLALEDRVAADSRRDCCVEASVAHAACTWAYLSDCLHLQRRIPAVDAVIVAAVQFSPLVALLTCL